MNVILNFLRHEKCNNHPKQL